MIANLVVLPSLLLALAAAGDGGPGAQRKDAAPVRVHLVKDEPAGAAPWVAASLAAARRATLSTRLSATVRAVSLYEGARVKPGEVLVLLADDDLRAQLAAGETALTTARAQEERFRQLRAERAATPVELEQAEAQRAQAEAAVAASRANLAYTEIRAPFAGTVQARRVNAGDLVGPGQPLLDVEAGDLELQASLSESEAQGLRIGEELRFEASGQLGQVRITGLAPGGDPLSHRRFLRARVTKGGEGLRSGSFARLELPAAVVERREPWLPRSAVVERGDLTGVFVAEGGRAHLRWVSLGEPSGDRVPVRAGLKPGEPVIDAPGALRDGEPVEVAHGD